MANINKIAAAALNKTAAYEFQELAEMDPRSAACVMARGYIASRRNSQDKKASQELPLGTRLLRKYAGRDRSVQLLSKIAAPDFTDTLKGWGDEFSRWVADPTNQKKLMGGIGAGALGLLLPGKAKWLSPLMAAGGFHWGDNAFNWATGQGWNSDETLKAEEAERLKQQEQAAADQDDIMAAKGQAEQEEDRRRSEAEAAAKAKAKAKAEAEAAAREQGETNRLIEQQAAEERAEDTEARQVEDTLSQQAAAQREQAHAQRQADIKNLKLKIYQTQQALNSPKPTAEQLTSGNTYMDNARKDVAAVTGTAGKAYDWLQQKIKALTTPNPAPAPQPKLTAEQKRQQQLRQELARLQEQLKALEQ